ncbi:MAG: serine/threonine-protein kinase [Anaerolineae bacterium]
MDTFIGKRLGQYEILSKLGAGGMASVYRARQTSVDRDVACKVIRADLTEDSSFTERFAREARTIASLSHLHILKVFDYGQEGSTAYLVMELMDGGSLRQLIQQYEALPLPTASRILGQIASALDYAHQKGIIHRDLKSDNVLMDKSQNAYLTDFGIARMMGETSRMTQTGTLMGTPAYMAPELWTGQPANEQTDIYALGVILYEMVTGITPFSGETPYAIMYQHLHNEPPIVVNDTLIDPAIQAVVQKALAKTAADRYTTATEMATAFQQAIGSSQGSTTPPPAVTPDKVVVTFPTPTRTLEDTKESDQPTVVEPVGRQPTTSPAVTVPPNNTKTYLALGAALVAVVLVALFLFSRNQSEQAALTATQQAFDVQSTAIAQFQTETAQPTPTVPTATLTPTPVPTLTPTITPLAFDQTQFETYTDPLLNVAFRYPAGWDVRAVGDTNLFVTEDFTKLDFSDTTTGVTGAPYIQVSVGNGEAFGALEMRTARTPQEALVAFMGRNRITNLDPVPGTRYPTATTTRRRPDLDAVREVYASVLGTDHFALVMLQASPDLVAEYNNNIALPLVRSLDNFTPLAETTLEFTPTPAPTIFYATPSAFATKLVSELNTEFVYPADWTILASKQSAVIVPTDQLEAFNNSAIGDFSRPMNIYMRFDGTDFIIVKRNADIETVFIDNYGGYTMDVTPLYDAPFPTVYARTGDQPVYGLAVRGWMALVKLRPNLYISVFAHAGAGREDAFLQGVLLPMLRGIKSVSGTDSTQ